jgi:phospho-N-acetylmuramoyl-pentapeptide-transferase
MLFHLFNSLRETLPGANVFRYVSTRIAMATLTALLITFMVAPWFIRRARARQLGELIRDDGPAGHASKKGTPTMGGALIIMALAAGTILWCDLQSTLVWLALLVTVGYGVIGFVDDYLKISKKNKKGLSARLKLAGQFLIGAFAMIWLYHSDALPLESRLRLALPLANFHHASPAFIAWTTLPLWAYIGFAVFVLMSESNAVNLTDGLDGLAISIFAIAAAAYTALAYVTGHRVFADYLLLVRFPLAAELTVFCGALVGASLGFLWYNSYPAEIFMGDVGSLALGAALATVAILIKQELLLVMVGGVFMLEALSVVIQVSYFRLTGGQRVFRMAPLHHHFEMIGWSEPKVITRFVIMAVVFALTSLATLKLR